MEPSKEELSMFMHSIIDQIRKNATMSQTAFDLWFSDLHLLQIDTDKIVFATGDELKRKFLVGKCTDLITKSVYDALGFEPAIEIICDVVRERNICIPTDRLIMEQEQGKQIEDDEGADFVQNESSEEEERLPSQGLCPEYTFENFIVGSSNQFAHACSVAVSNDPGGHHNYNPLFIYGPSGLGKTHLMYAIANRVQKMRPHMSIICTKSEDFMNELIESISKKTTGRFRDKYRKADMLLIDDIQFVSGKTSTQEEFFHTFNALYENRKQIVVTSDRPPREMFTLEERIKTRFVQGMIADVQPPEYELRLAILRKKAEKNNLNVPNNVLAFLAERLDSNIRQIEGALKKIGAVSFLSGRPITLEMVKSSIPEYFRENKPVSETVDNILEVTARKYDVTVEQILGKGRTKNIRTARNVSMYVIRKVLDLSLPAIGKMLDRDHSTVHSNIQAIEAEIQNNHRLNNEIVEIITEVKS
ncbi:MAG: chromosomal replication initiator protein DnaA [Clostridiales bacterium]|jgi:chromosomal replication initiator protein|nr:chromosomal replication initiator protein DnaA [Clostridiales bacterium]